MFGASLTIYEQCPIQIAPGSNFVSSERPEYNERGVFRSKTSRSLPDLHLSIARDHLRLGNRSPGTTKSLTEFTDSLDVWHLCGAATPCLEEAAP